MTNLMILHINKRLFVVTAFLVGVLAIGLVVIFPPRSVRSHKSISMVEGINESETLIQTKDFPERGIYLIAPSSPSFVKMAAQLMKSKEGSAADLPPYSVFLKNTGSHSVVGYSITWECVDKKGDTSHKEVSNIISYLFLYGDESDRSKALANEAGVIRPNSTWFISPDLPARRVEGVGEGQMEESTLISQPVQRMDLSKEFSKVTISLDGLFFDDGTFLGADTTEFFSEIESQMDARYEVLNEVEMGLKSGVTVEEILRKLEQMASQPMPQLGVPPSRIEYMNCFRVLFAKDVLGMKAVYGTEKAIADVHQQLSKPWVHLRRL